ncbi:MAG: DHH family phosphoesterase [Nitrososphaerales archaeon]
MFRQRFKSIYIITHRLADADAYCSAYGMAKLLTNIMKNSKVKVVFPEGLNSLARKIYDKYPIKIESNPNFKRADLIVIVDTNNPLLLSELMHDVLQSDAKKILIDHHPLNRDVKKISDVTIIDTSASSTSEIVYDLYRTKKVNVSKKVAQVLLIGIMADSQHLFLATGRTITVVSDLYKRGASVEVARTLLSREREFPERIARLKAASRIALYSTNSLLVAFSRIGSFHASAAKALVDLGADLGIVVGSNGKESKASLRSAQNFYKSTKVHLGTDIAATISEFGGGHPTAASLSSKIDANALEKLLMKCIEEKLGKLDAVR